MKKIDFCMASYGLTFLFLSLCINEFYIIAGLSLITSYLLLLPVISHNKNWLITKKEIFIFITQVLISLLIKQRELVLPLMLLVGYSVLLFKAINCLSNRAKNKMLIIGIITSLIIMVAILIGNIIICSLLQLSKSVILQYLPFVIYNLTPFLVNYFASKINTSQKHIAYNKKILSNT